MTAAPPLVLIDASSYFFRAFHALPPLKTSKGEATGAIYGVANMIKKLIKDYQPHEVAVVFDAKGKTFRNDLYPDYKAHRPPMPEELSAQFQPLLDLLTAMGLPLIMVAGVEADDVIGTLAIAAVNTGRSVLISTGDKDLAQLVNDKVRLINTMTNYTMDVAGVLEKFGILPGQMVDYLTLIGDSSDNIPGVTKCGPKTAVKWLSEHQTLDNLLTHADKISGKIGDYLRESIPKLPLSKKLVTIKTDVDLPMSIEELKPKQPDRERLIELIRRLEFKNWLKELMEQEDQKISINFSYQLIDSLDALKHWLSRLSSNTLLCIHPKVQADELLGLALAATKEAVAYLPLDTERQEFLKLLKPVLENPLIKKIGHNVKLTYSLLKNNDITLQGQAFDLMLESYVSSSSANRHDLENLTLKYIGHAFPKSDETAEQASLEASYILQLHHLLYPSIEGGLQSVFQEIEMPLISVLADMERQGVLIDSQSLYAHGKRLKERASHLEKEAQLLAGHPFNLNSPKQLQEILFDELQLPVISKTPKGQASTSEPVLAELAFDYRIAAVIQEYRGLTKLISTYIDALPKKINAKTQRVHTSYNQAIAATGRLSSSEPNLQNIPIRSEEGRLIRTAFIAPEGYSILAADYSQIELRIMAHLSLDDNLLHAFANAWDIHAATASEIFQTPLAQVTHEQRRRAKAVNFGLIYGMSAFGLAKQIGVERSLAQSYIDRYFERYPKVFEYMERTRQEAHRQGYVETLFGRRLYLPEISAQNLMRQRAAERAAINAPMQGTAADIIKKAMINIANWQQRQSPPKTRMIMQVHDELVFEVQQEAIEPCKAAITQMMETVVKLAVPLVVSIGVGPNWDAAH